MGSGSYVIPAIDEPPRQGNPRPVLSLGSTGFPDTFSGMQRMLPEAVAISNERVLERRLPVGAVLHLASVGLVAMAAIGVFFGIGFFLLVHPTEVMLAGLGIRDRGAAVYPLHIDVPAPPGADVAPFRVGTETMPSEAAAAIPTLPIEAKPEIQEAPPPRHDDAPKDLAQMPAAYGVSAAPVTAASVSDEGRPTTTEATVAAPDIPSAPAPSPPVEASLVTKPTPPVSAAEIAELLARGDAFLRVGDIASARLFYERAADAGDGQAAMRVGATFDPTFLGRAGLRGSHGGPAVARSWYRRGADLSAAGVERPPKAAETK